MYDVINKTWSEGPRLNDKRSRHSCIVDERKRTIHVMSGLNNFGFMATTEKWIFGSSSWEYGNNLPQYTYQAAAISSNSDAYVGFLAGGQTTPGASSKVWGLRRRDEEWIEIGSRNLDVARTDHSLIIIPGDRGDQITGC